jgi:hypothetical protein
MIHFIASILFCKLLYCWSLQGKGVYVNDFSLERSCVEVNHIDPPTLKAPVM